MITIRSVVFNLGRTLKPSRCSRGACGKSKSQSFEWRCGHITYTRTPLADSHPFPCLSTRFCLSSCQSRLVSTERLWKLVLHYELVYTEVGHQAPGRRKWGRFYLKELYFEQPILQGFINQKAPLWTAGSGLKPTRHQEALWLFNYWYCRSLWT